MKNLIILFAILCITVCISCEKNIAEEIPCEEECIFVLNEVSGVMVKMECFDTYGIKTLNTSQLEFNYYYIIPDDLDSKYEIQDKQVTVSAICRKNRLEPQFPDPEFDMNSLYQAVLIDMEENE